MLMLLVEFFKPPLRYGVGPAEMPQGNLNASRNFNSVSVKTS